MRSRPPTSPLVLYSPALSRKTDSYVNKEIYAGTRTRRTSVRGPFLIPLRTAEIPDEDRIAELSEYQEMPLRLTHFDEDIEKFISYNAARSAASTSLTAMTEYRNRYPGAQPFSDDDFSRKVFFGRESAARVLADKILANHLVDGLRTVRPRKDLAAEGRGGTAAKGGRLSAALCQGERPSRRPLSAHSSRPFLARRRGSTSSMCLGDWSRYGVSSRPPSSGPAISCSHRC